MNNITTEEWRPFDTGNMIQPDFEVSSLGKVRNKETGALIEPEKLSADVSPHYVINATYWRPEVLIRAIFTSPIVRAVVKVESVEWDAEIVENFNIPKRRERKKAIA